MEIDANKTFTEIPLSSAVELIKVLTNTKPSFVGVEDNKLFRGESDISRPLIPTAFRNEGMKKLIELDQLETNGLFKTCNDVTQNKGMWFHEKMAIAMFYKLANEQSLPLPSVSTETHVELLQRTNNIMASLHNTLEWPRKELFPIMALAQHYGFPTRLLDWSGDPLASAYFAASRGINYIHESGRKIGVWQTSTSILRSTELPFVGVAPQTSFKISIIDAPYIGNPNLSAQKGRFTLAVDRTKFGDSPQILKPLDEIFKDILVENQSLKKANPFGISDGFKSSQAFFKYTLPVSESANLLNRLFQMGYKASRFFPGYDSCIKTIDELMSIRKTIDY